MFVLDTPKAVASVSMPTNTEMASLNGSPGSHCDISLKGGERLESSDFL